MWRVRRGVSRPGRGDFARPGFVMEPLPNLYSGELDLAALSTLFEDLSAHAQVTEILVKGGATQHASGVRASLPEAYALLVAGAVRAVQIRYRWENQDWSDTILKTAGGARVVRMTASAG